MKKLYLYLAVSSLAASLFAASLAGAVPLSVSGSNDPGNYLVSSSAYPATLSTPITPVSVTIPAGPWVAGSWITFNNPNQSWPMLPGSGNLPGLYFYSTQFNIAAGLNPLTAIIKGTWSSDNGSSLFLDNNGNGGTSTLFSTIADTGYTGLANFTIDSGFVSGINTLVFAVQNDPYGPDPAINPTGLLVNIHSASAASAVPEPGTIMLLGAGFLGLALYVKRRKNA